MPCTPRSRPCSTPLKLRPRSLALVAGLVVAVSSRAGMRPVVLAQAPAPTLETGQVAEPDTYTTGPVFAGVGGSRSPLEQDLCEPSAKWLRLRFSELVLKGNDSLTLSGAEGGVFTFQGQHWENRSFFTRAFPGSCVHLSADLADPGSWFKVDALQFGTAVLAASPVVVAGAADICGSSCGATSDVILNIGPTSVFTSGDNAYSAGTLSEYNTKYDPTWGRFKSITRPTPGNHEYDTAGATGYFDYFNGVGVSTGPAGNRATGYYSYDVGDWHLIGLNSNLAVSTGSAQEKWLRADLAANTKPCTFAYWHFPRFSRGSHGSVASMQPLWQALYDFKADVVVNGHDHNYQRYAPQTPSGTADPKNGIREFVVGMGGASHYSFTQSVANFEVGNTTAFGVLKLTLSSTGYSWNFLPIAGASFTDSGSGTCHKAGSAVRDFSLGLSPTSLTISRGSSGSSTVTVTSLNGFSSATTLSVRGLPSGVTAAFSANPVTPPSGGSARSTLTLTASSTATTGTSTLTVTGTSGGISHSAALTLRVSAAGQQTLSVVKRGAIHSAADASSYSFPSITAAANRLYVVFLSTSQGSVTAPSATRLSGAGLSFTEIGAAGGLLYSGSTGVRRIQAWRALVASGAGTGAIAISLNGTSTGMDAVLLEFAGVNTSGTNGSGALAQSTSKATSATSLTLSLAAFGTSSNRPVAFFNHRVSEATTPEGGYTELDDASHGSPVAGAECEWNASAPDTTPSASWATSSQAGGFALEVRAGFVP